MHEYQKIFKKLSIENFATCIICGNRFYHSHPKDVKYCPKCNEQRNRKKYRANITNEDFKKIWKDFRKRVYGVVNRKIRYSEYLQDEAIQHTMVNIWLRCLYFLENNYKISELKERISPLIYLITKNCCTDVFFSRDLPKGLHSNSFKANKIKFNNETLSIDAEEYLTDNKEGKSLLYFIPDKKTLPDKVADCKRLTEQIMLESCLDNDVRATVVYAELDEVRTRSVSISAEEKIKYINEEFEFDFKKLSDFRKANQRGMYKLYSVYAQDIKDVLEISDRDFRFNPKSKEVAKNHFNNPVKRCANCGKAFICSSPLATTCKDCTKKRHAESKKLAYHINKKKGKE